MAMTSDIRNKTYHSVMRATMIMLHTSAQLWSQVPLQIESPSGCTYVKLGPLLTILTPTQVFALQEKNKPMFTTISYNKAATDLTQILDQFLAARETIQPELSQSTMEQLIRKATELAQLTRNDLVNK